MLNTAVTTGGAPRSRIARLWAWLGAHPWIVLPLLAVPAVMPLVTEGLPRTFDGSFHLLRIASLDRQLRAGTFLPRWQPEFLLGYGYPALNYYAPGSYYAVELLHLFGLTIPHAYVAAILVTVVGAGLGVYVLGLDLFRGEHAPALAAAAAYMVAPYLLINLYNRGALAETSAQALLPWLIWSARRVFHAGAPATPALLLALLLAALAVTHTISLLFVPPLLLIYLGVAGAASGRLRSRLPWAAGALLAAMGASAFFWLPLVYERRYLSELGVEIARQSWLPRGVWSWSNFVEVSWTYTISSYRPVRLGLVQLALAVAGVLLARRRDAEWIFWILVAVTGSLLIGAWSLPLWNGTPLVVAQFPWRLLGVVSLPMALLAGGIACGMPAGWPRWVASAATIAIVLAAQSPRLRDMNVLSPESIRLDSAAIAMMDLDRGAAVAGEGSSPVQEFRPRWAGSTLVLSAQPEAETPPEVTLLAANDYDLRMRIAAGAPTVLRFSTFYFPGMQATVDGTLALAPRPETELGILSVTVPAGEHTLEVGWTGTRLEHTANLISLATWLALGVSALVLRARRGGGDPALLLALLPLALAAAGVAGLLWTRALPAVEPPLSDPTLPGVRLLGARIDTRVPAEAAIRSFWQVLAPVSADTLVHWQLQADDGSVIADYRTRPYFNTSNTREWVVNSIVDDGYLLPLPAGLEAGSYGLAVAFVEGTEAPVQALEPVFSVRLDKAVPADAEPQFAASAALGNGAALAGYSIDVDGRAVSGTRPVLAKPGDRLDLTLLWRPTSTLYDNYHGFVHLVDVDGLPLAQKDQQPGPLVLSPELWLPGRTYADRYRLRIPEWTPSGIYVPWVGMYVFETLERIPAWTDEGPEGDHVALPPIKVVAPQRGAPPADLHVEIGDFATLTGASVVPEGSILPGSTLTVTLAYRSEAATDRDWTRFLQLHDPVLGMAAQSDGVPQRRFNPTWSWVPGEIIVEEVPLAVRADAQAGDYTLLAGFYDPATSVRAPLTLGGEPLADSAVPLLKVHVGKVVE